MLVKKLTFDMEKMQNRSIQRQSDKQKLWKIILCFSHSLEMNAESVQRISGGIITEISWAFVFV